MEERASKIICIIITEPNYLIKLFRMSLGEFTDHVGIVVIPETHDQDQSTLHGLAHLVEAAELLVVVVVAEQALDRAAEVVGDRVVLGDAVEVDLGDQSMALLAVLMVLSLLRWTKGALPRKVVFSPVVLAPSHGKHSAESAS